MITARFVEQAKSLKALRLVEGSCAQAACQVPGRTSRPAYAVLGRPSLLVVWLWFDYLPLSSYLIRTTSRRNDG